MLWFNTSHERDVVPLLEPLASARAARGAGDGRGERPLFDEAWFMEVKAGRPSRVRTPTAAEILRPRGLCVATGEHEVEGAGGVPGHETVTWQRTLEQVIVAGPTRYLAVG